MVGRGLRWKLFALAAIAVLPFLGERLYDIEQRRAARTDDLTRQAIGGAEAAHLAFDEGLSRAKGLLAMLQRVPPIRTASPAVCSDVVASIEKQQREISSLSVADPTGTIFCSSSEAAWGVRVGDRDYFKAAVATRTFSTSDFITSRVTGQPALVVAAPVMQDDALRYVLVATLNLDWLSRAVAETASAEDAAVYLLDRDGRIIAGRAREKPEVGRTPFAPDLTRRILNLEQGVIGLDEAGEPLRVLGVAKLDNTSARLVVDLPASSVVVDAWWEMVRTGAGVIAVAAAVVLFAWLMLERVFIHPLQQLTRAAARIDAGDLAVRADVSSASSEIRLLTEAFNGMVGRLETLAFLDGLTNLPNRRSLDERLEDAVRRANRYQTQFALALVDVDHFKRFNDRYGHPAGDDCLRRVAEVLRTFVNRPDDLAARYGGEEFALLLTFGTEGALVEHLDRLRIAVRTMGLPNFDTDHGVVTISVGTTRWRPGDDAASMLARADGALYEAKHSGRDRVVDADAVLDLDDGSDLIWVPSARA